MGNRMEINTLTLLVVLGDMVVTLFETKAAEKRQRVLLKRILCILNWLKVSSGMSDSGRVELCILRKVVDDYMSETRKLKVTADGLRSYFRPFALRALSERRIL